MPALTACDRALPRADADLQHARERLKRLRVAGILNHVCVGFLDRDAAVAHHRTKHLRSAESDGERCTGQHEIRPLRMHQCLKQATFIAATRCLLKRRKSDHAADIR